MAIHSPPRATAFRAQRHASTPSAAFPSSSSGERPRTSLGDDDDDDSQRQESPGKRSDHTCASSSDLSDVSDGELDATTEPSGDLPPAVTATRPPRPGWTSAEDRLLLACVRKYGRQWTKAAAAFASASEGPTRSKTALARRYDELFFKGRKKKDCSKQGSSHVEEASATASQSSRREHIRQAHHVGHHPNTLPGTSTSLRGQPSNSTSAASSDGPPARKSARLSGRHPSYYEQDGQHITGSENEEDDEDGLGRIRTAETSTSSTLLATGGNDGFPIAPGLGGHIWAKNEDTLLLRLVRKHKRQWDKMESDFADKFPQQGRTARALEERYKRLNKLASASQGQTKTTAQTRNTSLQATASAVHAHLASEPASSPPNLEEGEEGEIRGNQREGEGGSGEISDEDGQRGSEGGPSAQGQEDADFSLHYEQQEALVTSSGAASTT